jgi:aspartyl aminopeptidase
MKRTVLFTLTALTVASACLSRAAAQTQNTGGSSWVGKKSGWQLLKPGEQAQVMKFGEEYKRFMTAARTPATTVTEGIRVASEAGFRELRSGERAKPGDRIFLNNRGRALMLAVMGTEPVENGLRMIVSHIDSPRIEMKARPFFTAQGVTLVKTINHGGIKNYQWANRPLQINGRIDRKDGSTLWINRRQSRRPGVHDSRP